MIPSVESKEGLGAGFQGLSGCVLIRWNDDTMGSEAHRDPERADGMAFSVFGHIGGVPERTDV